MMRILQMIDTLEIGGAERMAVNIFKVLDLKKVDNYIVVTRGAGSIDLTGVDLNRVFFLNKKSRFDFFALVALFRIVRRIKPDFIHAHSTSIFWAVFISFFVRVKIIWHDHFGLSDILHTIKRRPEIFVSRWVDYVIVVNRKIEVWAKNSLLLPKKNICYIKNFPFLDLVSRRELDEKYIILNLANFRPQKDQFNLIEAAAILREQTSKNFEVWLVGAKVDVSWFELVEAKIVALDLCEQIKLIGPVQNINDVLKKSDIGVLSSESEGLPVSLLEYGLAALPVVCTDVGQCSSVLGNGNFGKVIPSKNPLLLAKSLLEIMNDPKVGIEMGERFKIHVENEYGYLSFFNDYMTFLNTNNKS